MDSRCESLYLDSLIDLPDEVLLIILSFLPVPDLLQCSRACHLLYFLAADPILHRDRLANAAVSLRKELSRRKTRAAISPPNAWIWLSKTNVLSRSISRSLIKIRLSHNLTTRPAIRDLVTRSVLPAYALNVSPILIQSQRAVYKHHLRDGLVRKLERRPGMKSLVSMNIIPEECARRSISPAIIETRRRVIKENLKDGLRAWVENRGLKAQQKRAIELDETERRTVKMLVRRLTARKLAEQLESPADAISLEMKKAQARWGRAREAQKLKDESRLSGLAGGFAHPTRAHVLGLKRFWEGVIGTTTG